MLGPACSPDLPADKTGVVLLCKKRSTRTGLLHQAGLRTFTGSHLS